jgi:hypothetical protein
VDIEKKGGSHEGFRRSSKITQMIMEKFRNRAEHIPIYVFFVSDEQPFYDEFKKIVQKVNFNIIEGVPKSVREYEKRGFVTKHADKRHWNELGHQIAAEKIIEYFKKMGLHSVPVNIGSVQ